MTFKTEIIAILDGSGSMANLVQDTIGGFNTFIDQQRALPGEARVTLVIFDAPNSYAGPAENNFIHDYKLVYQGRPIHEAPKLDATIYGAKGGTALFDAIGRTLDEQGARIAADRWAEKCIVLITTDGQENASRVYNLDAETKQWCGGARVKKMVEHAQSVGGWEFIYMSANPTAYHDGATIGLGAHQVSQYRHTGAGTHAVYAAMSATSAAMRGIGGQTVSETFAAAKAASADLDAGGPSDPVAAQSLQAAIGQQRKPVHRAGPSPSTGGTPAA